MEKMSDKNIKKAMIDTGYFATLPPANKMDVLIEDIIINGDAKKKNFERWFEDKEQWDEISMEDRMDEVLKILQLAKPGKALQVFQKTGFMAFCMPKCFPIKKLMDKKSFYAVIDHFDNCGSDDLVFRFNVLMFAFDPRATRETMEDANFDPDTIKWVMQTIDNYMDYLQVKHLNQLKHFLKGWGKDFYYYMDDYAQAIFDITRFNEYRRPDSRRAVTQMIKRGDPFEPGDLDITRQELIDAGAESEEEVDALIDLLLEHCLKKPTDNINPILMKLVKKYPQSKIDKQVKKLDLPPKRPLFW